MAATWSPSGDELKSRILDFWQQRMSGPEVESEAEGGPHRDKEKAALIWALGKLPVSLFPEVPKVVEVSSDASLFEAISILEKHNFRCLPVRSASNPDSPIWDERYLGVVDHTGIVLWVFSALGAEPGLLPIETTYPSPALLGLAATTAATLYAYSGLEAESVAVASGPKAHERKEGGGVGGAAQREAEEGAGGIPAKGEVPSGAWYATGGLSTFQARFREEILKDPIFHRSKVCDVIGSFRFTAFFPVDPSESVLSLLLLMAKERLRIAPIIAPQAQEIQNVVTQMGVVDFLCQCQGLPWFDSIARRSVAHLGLPAHAPGAVVKVLESDRMMEPFRLMLEHDVNGVPVVVPPEGPGETRSRLLANISASDILRVLHCPHLFRGGTDPAALTVKDFIDAIQGDVGGRRDTIGPIMKPPITCRPHDPLIDVMLTLCRSRIRRIYVTEDNNRLLGVITLRDIIGAFVCTELGKAEQRGAHGA